MTITIPQELRQPGGLDATLTGISTRRSPARRKKNYIVSSTKCPKGGWKFGSKLTFATRVDGTAAAGRRVARGQGEVHEVARCRSR